jgi:hypothetical protein
VPLLPEGVSQDGDWTRLLAGLQQLRSLQLTSELCAVGSFRALRRLRGLSSLQLHTSARNLKLHSPPGWLPAPSPRPPEGGPGAGPGLEQPGGGSGAWAALAGLQLDGLLLLEPLVAPLAGLLGLRTLLISGACLCSSTYGADADMLTRLSPLHALESFSLQVGERGGG